MLVRSQDYRDYGQWFWWEELGQESIVDVLRPGSLRQIRES